MKETSYSTDKRLPGVSEAERMRSRRIVDAMVRVVSEYGYARATITLICAEAKISRPNFYEAFPSLEGCFLAMMDDGYERVSGLIAESLETERDWQDGLRTALAALLALFDSEPQLARVWLVETLAADAVVLERRELHIASLTRKIVERWPLPPGVELVPLTATGVMESVLGIVRRHLMADGDGPLVSLLGQLMGLIVSTYLGESAVAAEVRRSDALAREIMAGRDVARASLGDGMRRDGAVAIPGVLADPRGHRVRACLRFLLENPGASNRQVARGVGVARDDQISTALGRLWRLGLLEKRAGRPGLANAWTVTPYGMRVARALAHAGPAVA